MTAYKNAPTERLKTQILGLYAYRYSASHLMKLHESVEKISARQIKKARAHAKTVGSGMPVEKDSSCKSSKSEKIITRLRRQYRCRWCNSINLTY